KSQHQSLPWALPLFSWLLCFLPCRFLLLSEFHTKPHQGDLGLFKGNGFLAGLHRDLAFFVAPENAGDFLQAVSGTVELYKDGTAHEFFKIPGTLQRPFQSGGAHLKVVALGDGSFSSRMGSTARAMASQSLIFTPPSLSIYSRRNRSEPSRTYS